MHGLIGHTAFMAEMMPVETWFVISVILGPVGYVIQDVVADAVGVRGDEVSAAARAAVRTAIRGDGAAARGDASAAALCSAQ